MNIRGLPPKVHRVYLMPLAPTMLLISNVHQREKLSLLNTRQSMEPAASSWDQRRVPRIQSDPIYMCLQLRQTFKSGTANPSGLNNHEACLWNPLKNWVNTEWHEIRY